MTTVKKTRSSAKQARNQRRLEEDEEINLLKQWIDSQKPECGSNPLSLPVISSKSRVGRLSDSTFSPYSGSKTFIQLPISKKTKDALTKAEFCLMTKIQRASIPHSICGRDVLGAAKTGSGKTLAFVIPVLEKLYREKWSPEDGVGSIIISPTRELASQLFDVLQSVGKYHGFSAGLFIGGREDVDVEKERANTLNILVCTPGRLLQHMDETPNFDCSQLQVLVLDEADRILDTGFQKTLNAIISQLPKQRQTLLFSATQTKKVQDLARLSLKDPEYISVVESAATPTPARLRQIAIEISLDEKIDLLWSFIKTHLRCKTLVFLSSCKQVMFFYNVFKKLHPGIPLKCLHGRMKQEKRMTVYTQFCEGRSVLFSTDVASRGLDFNKEIDWVVQVDCPEDVAAYIHRVGRTARYLSGGKSVLFLLPSETKMLEKLKAAKVPILPIKPNKTKLKRVSGLLPSLLVKNKELKHLAERAFITYLRSVHFQKDKEVFNLKSLPVDEYAASLGLPMTPRIRLVGNRQEKTKPTTSDTTEGPQFATIESPNDLFKNEGNSKFVGNQSGTLDHPSGSDGFATRVLKKKKLKINVHRPAGKRVVFDDEGNSHPPLAKHADSVITDDVAQINLEERDEYYKKVKEQLREADKEDKVADRDRRREKRKRDKVKLKGRVRVNEEDEEDVVSKLKMMKVENDESEANATSLEEQEALALKLLASLNC